MKSRFRNVRLLLAAALGATATMLALSTSSFAEPSTSQQAPTNTSPPTIQGEPREGNTLTATSGQWSGAQPMTFTFQWLRCNAEGAECQAIVGANSNQYTLTSADVGRRMRVDVTATNAEGSATSSATSAVVQARANAPQNTAAPTISGEPVVGQTLTAENGSWSGTQPITFAYQWQRCNSSGVSCSNIAGATSRQYVVQQADAGSTLRVQVTGTNSDGSSTATSAATPPVREAGPAGQIRNPDGTISIPITSVSLPARLIVQNVGFRPNPVRSKRARITIRVRIFDTRGFVVRGALVFVRSTPLVTARMPETPTRQDGWATLTTRPREIPRVGLRFPTRNGLNVQFFVRARKPGERIIAGVTGTRLTQVRTANPR